MLPKELYSQVRRIEIATSRLVTDVFAGEYHSVFKGRGMEFDEVREYAIGDDIRMIDWNVTARTGVVHVKKFVEERELTVMILVDVSASASFGSVKEVKSRLAAEIAAVLAFAAIRNNDKVGLIMFSDHIELFIPARKGLKHVLRIVREVLFFQPKGLGTNLVEALEFLSKVATRRSVAFVISDFFMTRPIAKSNDPSEALRKALKIANKKHDVIAVTLNDPREHELPDCGILRLRDAETGREKILDAGDRNVRNSFAREARARTEGRKRLFQAVDVDQIEVWTQEPFVDAIVRFFMRRQRKWN